MIPVKLEWRSFAGMANLGGGASLRGGTAGEVPAGVDPGEGVRWCVGVTDARVRDACEGDGG